MDREPPTRGLRSSPWHSALARGMRASRLDSRRALRVNEAEEGKGGGGRGGAFTARRRRRWRWRRWWWCVRRNDRSKSRYARGSEGRLRIRLYCAESSCLGSALWVKKGNARMRPVHEAQQGNGDRKSARQAVKRQTARAFGTTSRRPIRQILILQTLFPALSPSRRITDVAPQRRGSAAFR